MRHPSSPSNEALAGAFARMRSELETHEPPASVRDAVRARWARHGLQTAGAVASGPVASRSWSWSPWSMAALCGVLLLGSLGLLLRMPGEATSSASSSRWAVEAGFVPVAAAERWPTQIDRAAPAWVVRAELPRERLTEFGLPFDPTRASDTVRTELLVRASGEVLALRVLDDTPR